MRALFLSSVLGHKKFEDRLLSLKGAGYSVTVVAWDWSLGRLGSNSNLLKDVGLYAIPRPGRLTIVRRLMLWLRLISAIRRASKGVDYDVVIVNTLEMLVLARLFVSSAVKAKYFDLADIHPLQYSANIVGLIARLLERCLTSTGWVYVVTSPWFYWEYVVPRIARNRVAFLVENKVVHQTGGYDRAPLGDFWGPSSRRQIVILWNGVLRCNTSCRALLEFARVYQAAVRLRIAGDISRLDPMLVRRLAELGNVEILGKYDDARLSELFEVADFVWVSDFDDGFNSAVLLPNRIYQAANMRRWAFGSGSSATSKYVSSFGLGVIAKTLEPEQLMSAIYEFRARGPRRFPDVPVGTTWDDVLRGRASRLPLEEDLTVFGVDE